MKEISYYKEPEPVIAHEPGVTTKERSRGSKIAPTMRTYTQDVAGLVEREGVTRTKIIMAESERRGNKFAVEDLPHHETHLTRIIFILVLVLAFGVGVGIYALIGTKSSPDITGPTKKEVLVGATHIELGNAAREDILADLNILSQKISSGGSDEIVEITMKQQGGEARTATTQELLSALSSSRPDEVLLASLDPKIEYGMRRAGGGTTGYLFGAVKTYDSAFAGLLDWEKNITRDLLPAINPSYPRKSIFDLRDRPFKDERLGSVDARVMRDPDGNIIFAYAIVDKRTLIIAGNEVVLRALIERALQPAEK